MHQQNDSWTAYAAAEWVSRHMERGSQRFGNAGAIGLLVGGGIGPVGLDLQQRVADTDGSREFRGNIRAVHQFQDFLLAARATYVSDLRGNPSYWDLGAAIGSELIWGLRWQTEMVLGTEAKNFYLDAALSREWAIGHEWSILASSGLGINLGYQREASKGFDHAVVGLDLARSLGYQGVLHGGVRHFSPIRRDPEKHADHRNLYEGFVFQVGARWSY